MVSFSTDKAVILKIHMLIWSLLIFVMGMGEGGEGELGAT